MKKCSICCMLSLLLFSCTKESNKNKDCQPVTIIATHTPSHPCLQEGSITITAPTGNGITYKAGNGSFQPSPHFATLRPGFYTITVKQADECTASTEVEVTTTNPGPLFSIVKNLLTSNCTPCHVGHSPMGGIDMNNSCDIVTYWDRIKARAVDGNPSPMPQAGLMPLSERNKIMNWINAGHRFED
jgi:hypothetical protein